VPTLIERPAAVPPAIPVTLAKPAPAPVLVQPASLPKSTPAPVIAKPTTIPAAAKPSPRRSNWLACLVLVVLIAGLVVLCGIGALMLSGLLSINVSPAQPTRIAQATATRALSPTVIPSATPTAMPRATPTATVMPSPTVGAFQPITFAAGVMGASPNYKPVDAMSRFPEGIAKVYALIPYEGSLKGEQWRYERYLDGKLQDKLGGNGWDLSGPGTSWLNVWNSDGLTPGEWELRLYIADKLVQKGTYTVEKKSPTAPSFGIIRFAEGIQDGKPVAPHQPTDNFKAGTTQIYAFFDATNLTKQMKWKSVWYRDEKQVEGTGETKTWTGNPAEKDWWLRFYNDKGLASGTYELKLYIDDKLVQLGTFVIQ
jgi:hypothetical protein